VELTRPDGYRVSDDRDLIDRALVWRWISEESYWAAGRPRQVQDAAIDHSLCIGLFAPDGAQAGFCRHVTDYATFAYLSDVFVDPAHRGVGAGSFMVEFAITHPAVSWVSRQLLGTRDAHELYERFGYRSLLPDEVPVWMLRPTN
jgi:GNAT superfamily N-acetyltransferase